MKNKNTNSGITLIALIITIIVMLILVSVTITMAVNGGLFNYAQKAVGETKNAIDKEQELGSGKINVNGVWYDDIDAYIAGTPSSPVQISLSIAGEKVTEVPLPSADFEHVAGTEINTGYVIRHKTDGNEFVWVPVDKEQKITLKIESEKDVKEVKLIDPYGDKILTLTDDQIEKTFSKTDIIPTINGMYIAQVTTEEDEIVEKTLTVKSLYAIDAWNDWGCSEEALEEELKDMGIENKEQFLQAMLEDPEFKTIFEQTGCKTIDEFITFMNGQELKNTKYQDIEENNESNSVKANGGFYIARYEAGSTTERTKNSGTNGTPVSKADMYPYNYVTHSQAKDLAKSMYSSTEFTVSLLTGLAWDRTLGWINETGDKSVKEINMDSTDWGNYLNNPWKITKATAQYYNFSEDKWVSIPEEGLSKDGDTSILLTTGSSDDFVANNIFDLAGNVMEWTNETEAGSSDGRFIRGGNYLYTGSNDKASVCYNFDADNYHNSHIGFRPALYLTNK